MGIPDCGYLAQVLWSPGVLICLSHGWTGEPCTFVFICALQGRPGAPDLLVALLPSRSCPKIPRLIGTSPSRRLLPGSIACIFYSARYRAPSALPVLPPPSWPLQVFSAIEGQLVQHCGVCFLAWLVQMRRCENGSVGNRGLRALKLFGANRVFHRKGSDPTSRIPQSFDVVAPEVADLVPLSRRFRLVRPVWPSEVCAALARQSSIAGIRLHGALGYHVPCRGGASLLRACCFCLCAARVGRFLDRRYLGQRI